MTVSRLPHGCEREVVVEISSTSWILKISKGQAKNRSSQKLPARTHIFWTVPTHSPMDPLPQSTRQTIKWIKEAPDSNNYRPRQIKWPCSETPTMTTLHSSSRIEMPSLGARAGFKSKISRLSTSPRRSLVHRDQVHRINKLKMANISSISTKTSSILTASLRRVSPRTWQLPTEEAALELSEPLQERCLLYHQTPPIPQMAIWMFNLMPRVGWIRHSRLKLEVYQSSSKIKTPWLKQFQIK